MEPVPQDEANERTSSDLTLWAILSAGFFIRYAWLLIYPEVIENEGAVYASLAENLFAGKGYVWPFGGRYILFPPLYPILIGIVSFVTGAAADTASRIVSLGMGALLPVPVFLVTRTLFNRGAALAASALVAFHPMLIVLSGSGYSESIYFTNWFFGIHFALRTLERETTKHAALSGLFFGMAYLVRPEALAYSFLAAFWILSLAVYRKSAMRSAFLRAAMVILVTATLAAPYSAWLSINGGKFLVEGKSPVIKMLSSQMARGKSYLEAARSLGPDGEPEGVFLVADQFELVRMDATGGKSLYESFFYRLRARIRDLWREIWSMTILGSPMIVLLAIAGFLAFPFRKRKFPEEGFLASITAVYVIALLAMQWRWLRYLFPLSVLLIPWAGAGMVRISGKIGEWADFRKENGALRSRFAAGAASCLLVAAMAVPCIPAVLKYVDFHSARFEGLREAGQWLASRGGERNSIMCNSITLGYYSRGTMMYIPHAPEKAALEYIRRKNPDYIVLREDERDDAPYMGKWLQSGIPDPCAREIRRIRRIDELGFREHSEELTIYEWDCRNAPRP